MADQPKKYTPPPNKPAVSGKPALPAAKVGHRPPLLDGTMSVEVVIGDVTITIKGPIVQVLAVLNLLFGSTDQQAVIAKLQLAFGPEVSATLK